MQKLHTERNYSLENILGYLYGYDRNNSSKRKKSYRKDKERLWIGQGGVCYWCSKNCNFNGNGGTPDEFTIDHVIPLDHNGTNNWMNLVGSCQACNLKRQRKWSDYKIISLINPITTIGENIKIKIKGEEIKCNM
jgi:5-methylcytosine-specific restriction endonuclease McrA